MNIYVNNFYGKEDLIREFDLEDSDLDGVEIIFADYTYGDYEGDATVIFSKNKKLYEVNGYHCSCYGLEGQWDPEEVSLEEIKHRTEKGLLNEDILELVEKYEASH